jgi:hypothetical protein
LLINILENPTTKLYESRESISMNAIRCINALLILWREANESVSLIDSLITSRITQDILRVVRNELLRSLKRYKSNPNEAILIVEMLILAAQK